MVMEAVLTKGPIGRTLAKLTLPMVAAFVVLFLFQIVDSFFIAKLGTTPLAALTFCYPVIFIVMNVGIGIGVGCSAVVSKAIGEGKQDKVVRITSHTILLSLLIVSVLGILCFFVMEPLFVLMGAAPDMMPYILDYMGVWFLGGVFLVIPVIGNMVMRAMGDTITASFIMILSGVMNAILDPLLIFGVGIFPELGMFGAALATVLAWLFTSVVSGCILVFRERVWVWNLPVISEMKQSWREVLRLAVPSIVTHNLPCIGLLCLTMMVAVFSAQQVAGFGVALRIEALVLVVPMALSSTLVPFVGQNWGAGLMDRVFRVVVVALVFVLVWQLFLYVLCFLLSGVIGSLFSEDPAVVLGIQQFMWIVYLGYGGVGVWIVMDAVFNALHRTVDAMVLSLIRLVFLLLPLAYIGREVGGYSGFLWGIFLGDMLGAWLTYVWWSRLKVKKLSFLDKSV